MKTRLVIDEDSVYEIDAGGIIGLNQLLRREIAQALLIGPSFY
jgi:hypothetical protein